MPAKRASPAPACPFPNPPVEPGVPRWNEGVPLEDATWTRRWARATLNHMTAPAPHASLAPTSAPARRRQRHARRIAGALLDGLRFAAMAVVGVLGVWLLVLLFG